MYSLLEWAHLALGWDTPSAVFRTGAALGCRGRYRAMRRAHHGEIATDELSAAYVCGVAQMTDRWPLTDRQLRIRLAVITVLMLVVASIGQEVNVLIAGAGYAFAIVMSFATWLGPEHRAGLRRAAELNAALLPRGLAPFERATTPTRRQLALAVFGLWLVGFGFFMLLVSTDPDPDPYPGVLIWGAVGSAISVWFVRWRSRKFIQARELG